MSIENMRDFSWLITQIRSEGRAEWASKLSEIKKEYQREFEELRGTITSLRGAESTPKVVEKWIDPPELTLKNWFKKVFGK